MQNICELIKQIHSELSKINLTEKRGYIVSKQAENIFYVNQQAQKRMFRDFFTLEEKISVRQLQDMQTELDLHKADVNREIHNEIGKEFSKVIINLGRYA